MAKYVLGEKAANAVRRLMNGDSSVVGSVARGGSPVDVREFALPWTVEWAQSENSGSGSWTAWIPNPGSFKDGAGRSTVDAAFATMHQGLTDAANHAGWKKLGITVNSSATIYLSVTVPDPEDPTTYASCEIGTSQVSGATCIPIAYVSKDAETGEVKIKQFASGCIVLGSGSGSGEELVADSDSAAMSGRNSVEIDQQTGGPKYISLYQFEKTARPMTMAMTAEQESSYYEGTATTITGKYNGNAYCSMLIRKPSGVDPGQDVWELDYATLGVTLPPFVRGDANLTVGRQSIEVVTGYNQRYFQLHNFDTPGTYSNTINLSADDKTWINVANGQDRGSGEEPEDTADRVLIRTAGGTLVYRRIYVKALSSQQVTNICNQIINNYFSEGGGGIEVITGIVEQKFTELGDERYWKQGDGSDTCYGSAIGSSEGNTVINLSGKQLVGEWSCSGPITATGNLQSSASVVVSNYLQGANLCLGETTLTETQLIALKALIGA